MDLFLLPLFVAALLSPATSDHTDYPIRTTSNWNVTSFNLPNKDKVFLALRLNDSGTIFGVRVLLDGDNDYDAKCTWGHNNWDGVLISKGWIDQPKYSDQCKSADFSETQQKAKGRSLVVTSDAPTDWKLFSLPFNNSDIKRTSGGSAVSFNLPASEAVFILYHPEDKTKSNFELSFFLNDELIHIISFNSTPSKEWDNVAIYEDRIIPRYSSKFPIPMESRSLQGRRINVSSEVPIQWQMFSLPLESENEVESANEGEIKDCWFFHVLTIVISCLYVVTLIAAALFIYHLKASFTRSHGADTGPVNPVTNESQLEIKRTKSGNHDEPICSDAGNNEDPAYANVGNYVEHMHERHGNFKEPVRTNEEDAEEPIYEDIDIMHEQYDIGQAGRGHQHNEVDTFRYMIPKREQCNRNRRY